MAAAEYFASTRPSEPQNGPGLYPPPQPQRAHSSQPAFGRNPSQPGHPSPQHHPQLSPFPPPPYEPLSVHKPSVHFTPPPSTAGQHRPSFSNPSRLDPHPVNQNYPGQHLALPQQGPYMPPGYPYQPQPQPLSQSQLYPPPQHRPSPGHSNSDLAYGNGYSSDPEHHRRKHKERSRRISENSRSTATDGFLGAAGGGLLGDLIFPGLGTVGGALVGWVGGKDYGRHRKWREEKRDREQERWERKYGSHERSRSHSRDRRRSHD